MKIGNALRWALALALVILALANASWLAPEAKGTLRLIAAEHGDCPTVEQTRGAIMAGGDTIVLDADDKPGCSPASTALEQLPRYAFLLRVTDAAQALAMFDRIKRPVDRRSGFIGDQAVVAAIRKAKPDAWAFTIAEARKCFSDYVWQGWLTITPASCKGGTILVPIDQKWKVAGWPQRFQARMAEAGTRVILTGPGAPGDAIQGLSKLDEIPEIPRSYTGYAWIDDIELIGRAIRQ